MTLFLMVGCASSPIPKNNHREAKNSTSATLSARLPKEEFRVGAHTKLLITVYNEPDLTEEVIVSTDGAIDYSYVGKISVKGLTPQQLEKKLTHLLQEDYLVWPQLTIKVKEFGMVYVFGKVKNPGILKLTEQQTPLQVLATAGGFSPDAQKNKIEVIRTIHGGKKTYLLSLKENQGGIDLVHPFYLLPGDTMLVE